MHQNTMENKPKYEVTEQGKKAIRRDGVRLLSLDGGGVKGISALCTLQSIMEEVKRIEIECGINTSTEERRPKDYFELAVGTSTGGLIALMLFRLDMSVSQSIAAYKEMAGEIFKPSIRGISLARLHSVGDIILWLKLLVTGNGRFSTKPLLKAIDQLVRKYPLDNGDRDQGNEVLLMHKNAGMM
jgi:patatin-like phospholipase/acyl hydrolase